MDWMLFFKYVQNQFLTLDHILMSCVCVVSHKYLCQRILVLQILARVCQIVITSTIYKVHNTQLFVFTTQSTTQTNL